MSGVHVREEGAIVEVTIDRPKANAIDAATSRKLGRIFWTTCSRRATFVMFSSSHKATKYWICLRSICAVPPEHRPIARPRAAARIIMDRQAPPSK